MAIENGEVENPLSTDQVEPHDKGAGPHLLGDIEVALAALKGSMDPLRCTVLDRDKTVEVIELMHAKIAKVRAEL